MNERRREGPLMAKQVLTAARIIFGLVLLAGLAGTTHAQNYAQVRLDVP